MNCKSITPLTHQYLDGEMDPEAEIRYREHIHSCSECYQNLKELEKTISLLKSLPTLSTNADFTQRVLDQLPRKNRMIAIHWLKAHPFMAAASLFIFLMLGSSVLTWYDGNNQVQVLSNRSYSLIIENGSVLVPKDMVIDGDLIVKHGDIDVRGKVEGNVIAIDGKVLLASTASITGETEEINQVLEWIWYRIKSFGRAVINPS